MKAGGAERVISQLSNYMVECGIECTVVTLDDEEVFYQLNNKVDLFSIGIKSRNSYVDKFLKYRELRRYVKIDKPDIVLALPEEIGIFVIPALLGTKIPVVVSERNNPWIMPWKKATRFMRKLFYPFADGFIFQTSQAASFFPMYIQKKGVVLSNPLDLNRIPQPYNEYRRKEVVAAGRMDKQKNFPLLIKAFAKFYKNHTDYVLTIYGEGVLRKELEELASSILPHGSYSFPGRTNVLLEKMNRASMFVLSSDYEGMPNVIIEAMAMGLPVISTNCPSGGPADLIQNGENGILIPVGDLDRLCESMCMVAESEEYAQNLSNNAMNIRNQLDISIIAEKWMEYLECIISENCNK
jgi:glycosyltransferase involved in cell wall biosynthesis